MHYQAHPYQEKATNFILEKDKCALWLDCGLGKTVVTLTAMNELLDRFDVLKVLIIAPLRVAKSVWPIEMKKWLHTQHLDCQVIHGSVTQRQKQINSKAQIHIINYENVVWLVEQFGQQWPYDMVIADELSKLKNHSTKRWKALRKVLPKIDRLVGLTGTPVSQGLMDLWAPTYLLDQGRRLGCTFTSFRDQYFTSDYMGYNWFLRPNADKVIHKQVSDLCLSLSAQDYLDLPQCITNIISLELPYKTQWQYEQLEKEMFLQLVDCEVEVFNAAALTNKCLQFANGALYVDEERHWQEVHKTKLEALDDIIEESAGASILVAYAYQSDLERLQKHYPKAAVLGKDTDIIDDWNQGKIQLLLAHPASAGHGLNLQKGGQIIVWFGLTWSLELYQQFNHRLHRQGQEKPVFIHHLIAKNTIDESVLTALTEKRKVQDALKSYMDQKNKY